MTGYTFLLHEILVFFGPMSFTVARNEMNAIEGRLLTDGALSIGTTDHAWEAMGAAMGCWVSWVTIIDTCMTSH